jgi:selenide, water dikinase
MDMEKIKLTQYSHGAGCGCKLSPKVLEEILKNNKTLYHDKKLLVGNNTCDDAAVYDIGNGRAIISTTDFFMPIIDDPYDFGRIASVNSISDVYAMGGKPFLAISILGWPIDKLSPEIAGRVVEGSKSVCEEAGISLAGGHSIDSPEPIYGLAVTGMVDIKNLKQNSTARKDDKLFLTKPLGVGILTTAQKKGIVKAEDFELAKNSMLKLNSLGYELGKLDYVTALTDVTGFGLLGHLSKMCEESNVTAYIEFDKVPKFGCLDNYIEEGSIPGGTTRNWNSYGKKISEIDDYKRNILCDPQTSGGLLIAVDKNSERYFYTFLKEKGIDLVSFGYLKEREEKAVIIK